MEALQILPGNKKIKWGKYQTDVLKNVLAKNEISEDGLAVSENEYWKNYYNHPDFSYEWNNGYLEVKPMTDYSGFLMYHWFMTLLKHFLDVNQAGKMIGLDIGFRLNLQHKISIRKPDLAVILNDNHSDIRPEDCTYSGLFDLCIESLSHSSLKEIRRDTVQKKGEYENIGVKEYFILDARGRDTAFFQLDKMGRYRKIKPFKGDIIRSGVLKGFQFRISDLYIQPMPIELIEDEVYRHYVMIDYQMEKQRADKEALRAEQEKQSAEQEKQRAERLAEKLRNLGVSSEDFD